MKSKFLFLSIFFTSMSKSIEGFKRKPIANPTLHEGLLLLVYEFLKTQARGKSIGDLGCASEDTISLDFGDVQCVKFEDEEKYTKAIPAAHIPCILSRKSPICLPPIPPKLEPQVEKEDSEEEEKTNTKFEDEDKDNVKEEDKGRESEKVEVAPNVSPRNPKKRKVDQALLQEETNAQSSETPGPVSPISPPEEMIEIMVEKSGEVIKKNRRRAWRNFNMDM